jgi:cell division protein ZapE
LRRQTTLLNQKLYTVVADPTEESVLAAEAFRVAAGRERGGSLTVGVMMGRELRLPEAAAGVCRTSFADLCGKSVGAADYLALASACHTVILTGLPRMTQQYPEARRLVILIDILYERNIRLVTFARAPVHELFTLSEVMLPWLESEYL